jgi:hypothetical protein
MSFSAGCNMKKYRCWAGACIILSTVMLYLLTFPLTKEWIYADIGHDYTIQLADSLINGRIDLPNPKGKHDLVLWEGKYYSPFGVMPALVVAPLRLMFGSHVTCLLVSASLGASSILVWYGILHSLRVSKITELSNLDLFLLLSLTIFGGDFYWISTRGRVWYLNQTFTFFFISTALYFMLQRGFKSKVLSSLFFSCAFLTRNGIAVISPLYYLLLSYVYGRECGLPGVLNAGKKFSTRVVVLILVFLLSIGVQSYYNYVRFGNPLESGYRMQDVSAYLRKDLSVHGLFSVHYLHRNLRFYLLKPVAYETESPYILYDENGNSFWSYQPSLLIILMSVSSYVWWLGGNRGALKSLVLESMGRGKLAYVASSSIIWLTYLTSSLLFYAHGWLNFGNRYLLDVHPFLILLIVFSYGHVRENRVMRWSSYLLIVLSIAIGYQAKILVNGC